jgi:ribose 5-phosphate isomerase B
MRVGIATDHGGFGLKQELVAHLRSAGHEVVDFGAHTLDPHDDYPDFVIPLARPVVAGRSNEESPSAAAESARSAANRVRGIRAALIHDHSAGREDDHMNVFCMAAGRSDLNGWDPSRHISPPRNRKRDIFAASQSGRPHRGSNPIGNRR